MKTEIFNEIPMKKYPLSTALSCTLLSCTLLVSCVAEQSSPPESASSACAVEASQQDSSSVRKITPADLKIGPGYSTPVISNAQKFIIPVPNFGAEGEPLVYPPGHEKVGQPIVDYQGKPVGDRGLVFFNGKDQSWQAALGDGQAVIIINEVTQEQATQLYQTIQTYAPDPNTLTLDELKQVLTFAQEDLGLVDMYNSTRSFIQENMTPVIPGDVPTLNGAEIEAYGFMKRDDRDIHQALYIPGKFIFEGPAATPQTFENGGVIVEQRGEMRGVQPDIFERTYKMSDGRAIASASTDLESQCN